MKQAGVVAAVAMLALLALVPQAGAVIHHTDIYHVQMGMIPVGDTVYVDSVVVTCVDMKPTTYGFLAEERGRGPFSGVLVYTAYQRPDTIDGVGVVPGDLVRVQGRCSEYASGGGTVTEIDIPTVHIIQKGYGELAPQLLSVKDLGDSTADSTFCEKWEGVFIEVDTVRVIDQLAFNEFHVVEAHNHPGPHPSAVLRLGDKLVIPTYAKPSIGDTLALIKGGFSYEFSTYRLWPRSNSDITYVGVPPGPNMVYAYPTGNTKIDVVFDRQLETASAQNTSNYGLNSGTNILSALLDTGTGSTVHLTTAMQPVSQLDVLTVCDVNSSFGVPMDSCQTYSFRAGLTPITFVQTPSVGDTSQCVGQEVTVTGIVENPTTAYGGEYFLQDRSAGPWHGIYIYQFTNTFNAGDSAVVTGLVQEYYGETEISSVRYQQRIPIGAPVKVKKVAPATIKTGSLTAEAYEGSMVEVDSVIVYSLFDTYSEWKAGKGTDSVVVGNFGTYSYVPGIGSVVSVKGPLEYNMANFKIQPRGNADIVPITTCPAGVTPGPLSLSLSQNTPNPFVSETSIKFSIPSKMSVALGVYDVTGRLVKSVYETQADPGEHHATWDGKDASGAAVSPGVYFIRLATPQQTLEKKMVFVK